MTVGEQAGNGSVTRSGINHNQSQTTEASRPTSKQTCKPYNHATLQADRYRMDFSGRAIQAAENVMMNITKSQLPQTAYCCCVGIVESAPHRQGCHKVVQEIVTRTSPRSWGPQSMIEVSTCHLWRECSHRSGKRQCLRTCRRVESCSDPGARVPFVRCRGDAESGIRQTGRQTSQRLHWK